MGFFEGFNYVVICEKLSRRYPANKYWLDYGAIACAIVCILFHPLSTSFWGIVEIVATFIAIYGMLIVRKKTGNAWECVFASYGMLYKFQFIGVLLSEAGLPSSI